MIDNVARKLILFSLLKSKIITRLTQSDVLIGFSLIASIRRHLIIEKEIRVACLQYSLINSMYLDIITLNTWMQKRITECVKQTQLR